MNNSEFGRVYEMLSVRFSGLRSWVPSTKEGVAAVNTIMAFVDPDAPNAKDQGMAFLTDYLITDLLCNELAKLPVYQEMRSVGFSGGQFLEAMEETLYMTSSVPAFVVYVWVRNKVSIFGEDLRASVMC